jgi:hypothetical protein
VSAGTRRAAGRLPGAGVRLGRRLGERGPGQAEARAAQERGAGPAQARRFQAVGERRAAVGAVARRGRWAEASDRLVQAARPVCELARARGSRCWWRRERGAGAGWRGRTAAPGAGRAAVGASAESQWAGEAGPGARQARTEAGGAGSAGIVASLSFIFPQAFPLFQLQMKDFVRQLEQAQGVFCKF